MSARRTERLLNLVICLLATRRWLTKEQIRAAVPQYADCESDEAFDRMFERDKEDLRELGIPVVVGTDQHAFDDEAGYRIDRQAYALPPIELDAEELAVIGLASRVWQQAGLAGPAARGLVKLTSLGVDLEGDEPIGLEARVRTPEPAFAAVYAATRDRRTISFSYRKPDGQSAHRVVQPWAVASRLGHWYLLAWDTDRQDIRVFRLSRIDGEVRRVGPPGAYQVPDGVDARDYLGGVGPVAVDGRTARIRIRARRGAGLRSRALGGEPAVGPDGWDEITVPVTDLRVLAEELAGYGPDVVALEPADLRAAVRGLLEGALAAGSPSVPAVPAEPGVPA